MRFVSQVISGSNTPALSADRKFALRNLILLLILISIISVKPKAASWNDSSRMAVVQSLVEHGTFAIDRSVFSDTGDKIFVNGHFYSDKPALPAILGAAVYWPLYHLGIRLDYGWNASYYLITLFTVKLFWIIGLAAFYSALGFTGISNRKRFWLTLALGIASLHFTWSSTFNNHSLAASMLMTGYYFLLRARYAESDSKDVFYGGFFLALAAAMDIPTSVFYAGFAAYILTNPPLRKKAVFYFIPLLFTALPALLLSYLITGSIIPAQIDRSYFEYPGSPWNGSNELSGISVNSLPVFLEYSAQMMIGPKGFLLYNPFLWIALPLLIREIKNKSKFRKEALVIGTASLIMILYYLLMTNNYAGDSYSIRWFVPFIPLWFFFLYPRLRISRVARQRVFNIFFTISLIISVIGLINPWTISRYSSTPFVANIQQVLSHFSE
ncbi:MAG: hypothetical protein AB7W47_04855 [Calditrichaceae bacterium]